MNEREVLFVTLIVFFIFLISIGNLFLFSFGGLEVTATGHGSSTGSLSIFILPPGQNITIHSPLNQTYYFNVGDPLELWLNVSASFIPVGWRYELTDGNSQTTYSSFTPNETISVNRYENFLEVFADIGGYEYSSNVTFFVYVTNSAPILGPIDSDIYVCEGFSLSYEFNATDSDEDTLVEDIFIKNPFYTRPIGSVENVSYFEIFSGNLTKSHVGIYSETVTVNDLYNSTCCVDSKDFNITVIEINSPPEIEGIGAQTVWTRGENSTFYHQMVVDDIEDGSSSEGNLFFNLTFGANENLFTIDNYGVMNYTPVVDEAGTYSVRVCARDNPLSSAHSNISLCYPRGNWSEVVCDDFTITVTNQNRAPEIINYSPVNLTISSSGTSRLYFNATVYDPDYTIPDIDWYVDDELVEHNENKSNDSFNYSFGCGVRGLHTIKIVTTDGLLNDSYEWMIDVSLVACPERGGGGGGGGGGIGMSCFENWVCDDWQVCQNVERSYDAQIISYEDYIHMKEICLQEGYDDYKCGFQIKDCYDLNNCSNRIPVNEKPNDWQVCYFTENPSCFDGIKNCHDGGCEILIDCGGPCPPCPTCTDGIQNQGEAGIDCGGPCPFPCEEEIPFSFISRNIIFLWILLLLILAFIVYRLIRIQRIRKKKNGFSTGR